MSYTKEIYINVSIGSTRIAILENGVLVELYIDIADHKRMVGNVYKGKSQTLEKNAFKVHAVRTVGNYAVRMFWQDRHANGIYTFDFLRTLSE